MLGDKIVTYQKKITKDDKMSRDKVYEKKLHLLMTGSGKYQDLPLQWIVEKCGFPGGSKICTVK